MITLNKEEEKTLKRLKTPSLIQDYLDSIPFNFEKEGETCMSPYKVLKEKKAHCIEGAMLAAYCLSLQGQKPLLLSLKVAKADFDHVVAIYKNNGYFGAISKTNHSVLRFRDPVYKTLRELAMSYFHEYFLVTDGTKTMRGYSPLINLYSFGKEIISEEKDLWHVAESIYTMKHHPITKSKQVSLRKASQVERTAANIEEWNKK